MKQYSSSKHPLYASMYSLYIKERKKRIWERQLHFSVLLYSLWRLLQSTNQIEISVQRPNMRRPTFLFVNALARRHAATIPNEAVKPASQPPVCWRESYGTILYRGFAILWVRAPPSLSQAAVARQESQDGCSVQTRDERSAPKFVW